MAKQKVIRVFISSTFEDFEKERNTVKTAIDESRRATAIHGIVLLPVDMRSGANPNPPFEACLKEVAASQILIGLIGARYGCIDPQSGKSISELEYEKSVECKIPQLMYLRTTNTDKWTEKDADLVVKLNSFRKKVEQNNTRDTFDSCDVLRGHILRDLAPYIIEKYGESLIESEVPAIESPLKPAADSEEVARKEKPLPAGIKEGKQLFKFLSDNLNDTKNIDGQKRRRLFFLAASLFYETELSETLGTHEIGLFYKDRKSISLLGRERAFLIKHLFADASSLRAGWFWMRDIDGKPLFEHLRWLCINEGDKSTQIGCLQLLKNFWSAKVESVFAQNISATKEVSLKALEFLEILGTKQSLVVINNFTKHDDLEIQRAANKAKLSILAKYKASEAISLIQEFENEYATGSISNLGAIMLTLDVEGLKKIKEHKDKKIKRIAVIELAKRGVFEEQELNALVKDNDTEIKFYAYSALIDKGKKYSIEEVRDNWPKQSLSMYQPSLLLGNFTNHDKMRLNNIISKVLATYSLEDLVKRSEWMQVDNDLAYLEFGLRKGIEFLKQVRTDLEFKFDRLKNTYIAQLIELKEFSEKISDKRSVTQIQALIDSFYKNDDFQENHFIKSALKILIQYGTREDVRFAKQFMASEDRALKEIAMELFIHLADKDELSELVNIIVGSNAENIKEKAAIKALSLDDKGDVLKTLYESNSKALIKLYLKTVLRNKRYSNIESMQRFLLNSDEEIREMAVSCLMKLAGRKRTTLERILDKYLENRTYYYNVVCWLDRIIYAPQKFKTLYRKQLATKLD